MVDIATDSNVEQSDVTQREQEETQREDTQREETQRDDSQQKRTFDQEAVNEIVRRAKSDAKRSAKAEFERGLEGKIILEEGEYQARVQEAVQAALEQYQRESALQATKAAIQKEYRLTDSQVARLRGETDEDLRKDAEEVFGVLKRKEAPALSPGVQTEDVPASDNVIDRINDRLRKKLSRS